MNIKSYEELASRIQLDYNLNAKDLAAWARALNTSSKKRAGYFVGRLNMEHLARAIVFLTPNVQSADLSLTLILTC